MRNRTGYMICFLHKHCRMGLKRDQKSELHYIVNAQLNYYSEQTVGVWNSLVHKIMALHRPRIFFQPQRLPHATTVGVWGETPPTPLTVSLLLHLLKLKWMRELYTRNQLGELACLQEPWAFQVPISVKKEVRRGWIGRALYWVPQRHDSRGYTDWSYRNCYG